MSTFHWNPITIVVIVFVCLSSFYSFIVPLFEAPDELGHYMYVRYLAQGHGLPVRDPQDKQMWEMEANQPPLFYALGALSTIWIDSGDLDQLVVHSPYGGLAAPSSSSINKNRYLHTEQENYPFRRTALAVHMVRLINVILGAATVVVIYSIAREVFELNKGASMGATAIAAFNPQFVFLSGTVNNDISLTFFSALILLGTVHGLKKGFSSSSLVFLGFGLGLALLVKSSAFLLWPLVLVAIALVSVRKRSLGLFLRGTLVVSAIALAVAGWWYLRNWILYGEPLALTRLLQMSGGFREPSPTIGQLLPELKFMAMSYWAAFGWGNILVHPLFYAAIAILAAAAFVGLLIGLVGFLRARNPGQPSAIIISLLLLWVATFLLSVIKYMQITYSPYGRHLFPAMPAISILMAYGLSHFFLIDRVKVWCFVGLGAGLLLFSVYIPYGYLIPSYAKPRISVEQLRLMHRHYDVTFRTKFQFLGFDLVPDSPKPGQKAVLTLYWRSLAKAEENYKVFIHVISLNENIITYQADALLGSTTLPTQLWQPGDLVRESHNILLPSGNSHQGNNAIRVGVYSEKSMERLPALNASGEALDTDKVFIWNSSNP